MEKLTCILIEESDSDLEKLKSLLEKTGLTTVIGTTKSTKTALDLVKTFEPNILFLVVKTNDLNAFKFIDKIEKQPTIVFLTDNDEVTKTFEVNRLNYLKKPFILSDVERLLQNFQSTHQQIANKMQGLLSKLKLED